MVNHCNLDHHDHHNGLYACTYEQNSNLKLRKKYVNVYFTLPCSVAYTLRKNFYTSTFEPYFFLSCFPLERKVT